MKFVNSVSVLLLSALLLFVFGGPNRANALLASHECTFCHDLHGGPGYEALLTAETSELVCLSCHTVSINDTAAAEVHNPLGLASNQSGYITCRECHDAHSNQSSNIKLVGYKRDGENFFEPVTPPAIRKETPSTVGLTYNVVTFTSSSDFNIASSALMGPCEVCHNPYHNAGNDCTQCHSHSGGFSAPSCTATGCHDGNGTGALAVGESSEHSTNTIFASKGVTFTCGDCHSGHMAGNVQVPNNPLVGIDYLSVGHNGISLGSTVAAGATEAEICWNCHATYGVSEWGLNTDTNGAGNNYDFGSLSGALAPAWVDSDGLVGAIWTSAQALFSYKTGNIASTHSVNNSATLPGLDPVANIRCSYCHDVHQLNLATGDTTSGKPYLRGSWQGNPYREDGAPQASVTYASQGNFGPVPRGGVGATEMGGYQIDQNNGNPTSGWTLASSAGICTLCHGTNVDDMNYFGTASDDWVGTNGHSNAVLGGTRSNEANIFREDWRKPNDGYCDPTGGTDLDGNSAGSNSYCAGYPNMANQQFVTGSSDWGGSFRGAPSLGDQGFRVEPDIGANQPFAYEDYNWGATVDTGTIDPQYHKFSCSKCHNPHASRLPRLMITNCLDISHNTWDDAAVTMVTGDSITISGVPSGGRRDCSADVNATFSVELLLLGSNEILIPVNSFTTGCTNQSNVTLNWNGSNYILNGVDFTPDVTVGSLTYDKIGLNADLDMQQFIGRQVHSSGTENLAGLATVQTDNDGVILPAATSAQNCHRYVDVNGNGIHDSADQQGWNKLTPWVETP